MTSDPTERALRNAFHLRRVENSVVRELSKRIDDATADIESQLRRGNLAQRGRISALEKQWAFIVNALFTDIQKELLDDLANLARDQAVFASNLIGVALENLSKEDAKRLAKDALVSGAALAAWLLLQEKAVNFNLMRQLRMGLGLQEDTDQLARRLRGLTRERNRGGVAKVMHRNVASLTRTSITNIATQSQVRVYGHHAQITTGYVYTAVLDGHTTDICMSLDGRVYQWSDPKKRLPPQHWGCRSHILPLLAGGKHPRPYTEWLREQTNAKQDEILGPGRAALFRQRRITLRDLVRFDLRTVPLDQLGK